MYISKLAPRWEGVENLTFLCVLLKGVRIAGIVGGAKDLLIRRVISYYY